MRFNIVTYRLPSKIWKRAEIIDAKGPYSTKEIAVEHMEADMNDHIQRHKNLPAASVNLTRLLHIQALYPSEAEALKAAHYLQLGYDPKENERIQGGIIIKIVVQGKEQAVADEFSKQLDSIKRGDKNK